MTPLCAGLWKSWGQQIQSPADCFTLFFRLIYSWTMKMEGKYVERLSRRSSPTYITEPFTFSSDCDRQKNRHPRKKCRGNSRWTRLGRLATTVQWSNNNLETTESSIVNQHPSLCTDCFKFMDVVHNRPTIQERRMTYSLFHVRRVCVRITSMILDFVF
jgi:hypothetical protein